MGKDRVGAHEAGGLRRRLLLLRRAARRLRRRRFGRRGVDEVAEARARALAERREGDAPQPRVRDLGPSLQRGGYLIKLESISSKSMNFKVKHIYSISIYNFLKNIISTTGRATENDTAGLFGHMMNDENLRQHDGSDTVQQMGV